MRRGIAGRRADSVPIAILFICDHLFDLRCGSDFPGAVCRGIHRPAGGRVHRDSDFSVIASGGTRLGMGQGLLKLGEVTPQTVGVAEDWGKND